MAIAQGFLDESENSGQTCEQLSEAMHKLFKSSFPIILGPISMVLQRIGRKNPHPIIIPQTEPLLTLIRQFVKYGLHNCIIWENMASHQSVFGFKIPFLTNSIDNCAVFSMISHIDLINLLYCTAKNPEAFPRLAEMLVSLFQTPVSKIFTPYPYKITVNATALDGFRMLVIHS